MAYVCPNCYEEALPDTVRICDSGSPDYYSGGICPHCNACILDDDWLESEDNETTDVALT